MKEKKRRMLPIGVGVLLGLAGCWVLGTIGMFLREPDALTSVPVETAGRFIELDEGRVHVVENGHGPPMVLLHGTGGSVHDWPPAVVDRLAEKYRVIRIELYGWGFSERDSDFRYGGRFWSDQIHETLKAMEIKRAVIVGHSLGALVADIFAADHPEMTSHLIISGHGETLAPAYFLMLAPGIGELAMAVQAVPAKTFNDEHQAYQEAAFRIRGSRKTLLQNARGLLFQSGDFFDAFPRIQVPVLQIHGTEDEEIPTRAMMKTHSRYPHPDKRIVMIEGAHHFVMHHSADAYTDAILDFLNPDPAPIVPPKSAESEPTAP